MGPLTAGVIHHLDAAEHRLPPTGAFTRLYDQMALKHAASEHLHTRIPSCRDQWIPFTICTSFPPPCSEYANPRQHSRHDGDFIRNDSSFPLKTSLAVAVDATYPWRFHKLAPRKEHVRATKKHSMEALPPVIT